MRTVRNSLLATSVLSVSLASTTLFMGACGDDTGTGAGGAGNGPSSGGSSNEGGAGGSSSSCDLPALDLQGLWAVKMTVPVSVSSAADGAFATCPASQQGEATVLYVMNVTSLATNHSARFSVCSVDFPEVTGSTTACGADEIDVKLLPHDDRIYDDETEPMTIAIEGDAPGTAFTLPSFRFDYGVEPPLREWDTTDIACDDPAIGHGGACEETCVVGGCEDLDYWNDDFPGFTWGLCGIGAGQAYSDCELDDPASVDAATMQGSIFTTMSISSTLGGTFDTSCEGTGTGTTDVLLSLIGANVYVAGEQATVSATAKALPSFAFDADAVAVRFVRIDGRHGSLDYAQNDIRDTCELVVENASTL